MGAENSKTRDALLDCVESLMLEQGYAAVTFRAVATKAGVTSSLVQYYFRTLDGIFLAAIRRNSERSIAQLTDTLREPSDRILHTLWEFSWNAESSALVTEFMALGNHRKSVRTEIADITERVRRIQLDALTRRFDEDNFPHMVAPGALLLLITGIPKFLDLEKGIGVTTAHRELIEAFEHYLDRMENPGSARRRRQA